MEAGAAVVEVGVAAGEALAVLGVEAREGVARAVVGNVEIAAKGASESPWKSGALAPRQGLTKKLGL